MYINASKLLYKNSKNKEKSKTNILFKNQAITIFCLVSNKFIRLYLF